jgi:CheY-like chemotaxis protein
MSSKSILIVDDEGDVRFVLGAILNFDGYHVLEAANGEERSRWRGVTSQTS